ncbi:MAG: TRAP transporter substrate-binding protein [Alphaproteobacteria bacterium]|nr:TRAP transporter substrate-binding protein [Alphaproteobacteria bacterium]
MERRSFLGGGVAGAATAFATTLAAPAVAQSAPEIRWRMTSSFPKSLDTLFGDAELIAKRVAALTDNKFQIRVFAAGEVVPALQAFDAVQNETVECAQTASYYYVGKDPTFAFDTTVPFGPNARQQSAWMLHGGGLELMREFFRQYNVLSFPCGNTGAQMGGWYRKEIKSLGDLKGLKFRIAGFAGMIFAKLGAVPQQLAASDIYPALEKGTIDAAEWVGPYDDEKLGLYKVAPYYYYPGFWEGQAQLSAFVNLNAWNKLPEAYRAAFQSACAEAYGDMLARYDTLNPQALRRLVAAGAQLRPFSRDILAAAWKAANEIYDETSAKNANFKKVYESWRKFRDDEFLWFRVSENSYENFAFTAAQTVR